MFTPDKKIKFCQYRLPCGMCMELKIECPKMPINDRTDLNYTTISSSKGPEETKVSDCTHY